MAESSPSSEEGRGGAVWIQGLVCGAIATLATPTAVLGAILLAPGFAALLFDRTAGKPMARTVLVFGLAASAFPFAGLWRGGHTLHGALDLAADPLVLATAWVAQAGGWLLTELAPLLVRAALEAQTVTRRLRLAAERRRREEEWGIPPSS